MSLDHIDLYHLTQHEALEVKVAGLLKHDFYNKGPITTGGSKPERKQTREGLHVP